jgi:hypothetical protein
MADKTWVGGTSDDAAVDANWSPSGVPASNDKVAIPDASTTSNDCRLTAATSWGTLSIATDGILVGNGQMLTLNGGVNDGGTAADFNYTDAGQTSNVSGNLDITMRNLRSSGDRAIITAAANNIRNLKIDDFTADGGGTGKVYHFQCNLTISGDLTVEYGELNTAFSSTSYNLTVAGKTTIGPDSGAADQATLTCNASTMSLGSTKTDGLGLHVRQGGTFVGGSGTHTMGSLGVDNNAAAKYTNTSDVNTLNGHSNDSTRVIIGGALSTCTAAGTITITYAGGGYNFQNGNAALINNLTLNSDVTANLSAATSITGDLTISQGTLTTTASDYALTVTGKTEITSGTLTLNGSTCLLNSGGTAGGLVLNANATVLADADSTVTMGSIEAGYDSSINIRLAGTNTINNYRSSTDKTMKLPPGVVDPVSSTTSFTVTTSATNTEVSAVNLVNLTFTPASGTPNFNLDSGYGGIDIEGDLTINTGATITSNNQAITVVGEVNVAGTLDCGSSVCSFGSLDSTGLTELADSSGSTLITNENSDGLSIVAGTFGTCVPAKIKHNNGTVTFNNHSDPAAHAAIVVGNSNATDGLYNVIIDGANTIVDTYDPGGAGQECKIHNNFTVTNGSFQVNGASNPFDVGGNVLVSAGKMFGDGSAPTGAMSFGSLTIESGAEFRATSATTTITNKNGSNYIIDIDGIFTHNSGTVYIDTSVTGDKLLDLIPSSGVGLNHLIVNEDGSGVIQYNGNTTIAGDLTIEEGTLHGYDYNNSELTVTGGVTIEDGGTLGVTNQTGAYSFGSLTINSGGTFIATSGETSITGAGGLSRAGTFTHNNGTVDFEAATTVIQSTTMTGSNAFYILKSTGTTWYRIDQDIDIERHASTGYVFWFYGDVTVTMGTDTHSSGTDNSNKCIGWSYVYGHTSSTYKLYAKNELYPWLYDYPNVGNSSWINGSQDARMGIAHLKGGNIIGDFTIAETTNPKSIVCDGDMEFDGVTVGNTNTLNLNGQRVKFGGLLSSTGTIACGTNALVVADSVNTSSTTSGNMNLIETGDGHTHTLTSSTITNWMLNGGTISNSAHGHAADNIIIATGKLDQGNDLASATPLVNVTTATGADLDSNTHTLTLSGDLTMSGGLIGKSAFEVTGTTYASGSSILDYSSASVTAITMSGWVKLDDVANGANNQFILRQNDNFIGLQADGSIYVGVELQNSASGYDYPAVITSNGTIGDDKWHHVAMTWASGSTLKAYMDGKLIGENTSISADYVRLRQRGAGQNTGVGGLGAPSLAGIIAQTCRWHTEKTPQQIRTEMFQDFSSLSSNTDCIYWYQFDTGTGTTVFDSTSADCDLTSQISNGTATASWAGAGTYDKTGGPAIVMAGTTQDITCKNGLDIYDLTINDGSTTSIHTIDNSAGRLDVYGNLTVNEKLTSSASSNTSGITMKTAATTLTVASDVKTTALATLYQVVLDHGGTTEIDEMNLKVVELQSGATLKATGDFTVTTELEVGGACTLNANGKTLTCKLVDMNGTGTLNLVDSTLILSSTDGVTTTSNTILNGGPGTTVSGSSAATTFESQNNFVIVGNITNLDVTNEELSILGNVTNCTGDIHRWNPTIDTGQMLDADTADDRDVRLGSDLDRNTELVT